MTKINIIAIIGRFGDFSLMRSIKKSFRTKSQISTHSMSALRMLEGINFSDHASYWDYGFPAVMITDTSFLRNPHYHKSTDTIDTLNFDRMSEVVNGLYATILEI